DRAVALHVAGRAVGGRRDGREAFSFAARIGRVHPNRIAYGRGPRGHGAEPQGRFSGTIVPEAMLLAGPPGLESLPPLARLPAIYTEAAQEPPASPAARVL